MPQPQEKLFLIDAMALIYRAYFALIGSPRINSKGLNTSAILGFANALVEILRKQKPTHIAVAFDMPGPTFRKEIYSKYKAHREAQPEDITASIPYIQKLLAAFGIPIVKLAGYEADDVIGTLAQQAATQGMQVYMMTPDKDLAQLVEEKILLYKPPLQGKRATIWGVGEVCAHWQIQRPLQVIDRLALEGDVSDNIPGIPGIGPKTAAKLIETYDSVEALLENRSELAPSIRKKLEAHHAQTLLSKRLATIACKAPITFNAEESRYTGADNKALATLLDLLEFRTLKRRLFSPQHTDGQTNLFQTMPLVVEEEIPIAPSYNTLATTAHSYHAITSLSDLQALVDKVAGVTAFALDTETTGLDVHTAKLLGISLCYSSHEAYYIALPPAGEAQTEWLAALAPLLVDKTKCMVGQNLKYDLHILARHGLHPATTFFDTMVAHHLRYPEQRHSLDSMVLTLLNYSPIPITDLIGPKGPQQLCMDQVALEKMVDYACEDADITWQLYEKLLPKLKEDELMPLFRDLEMPLLPILVAMEQAGVYIDQEVLQQSSTTLGSEIKQLEAKIYELAGSTFNISSPKQLGIVLFEELKLVEKPSKTKTGQYSTNEAILTKLIKRHAIIPAILAHRALKKLKSTYIDALPTLIQPHSQRVHTTYHQAIVYTGRLSSSHPNLQNIPIRSEKGRVVRRCFVAQKPNHLILSADYSQVELRLMAHFAEDEAMIAAFEAGEDIHTATAQRLFQLPAIEVTPEMRRQAKTVNFGIIYGISAFGLSERLSIKRREAQEIIEAYFSQFFTVKAYMEQSIASVRNTGYITTLWGRRRYFPDINSRNATLRGLAERAAINMPIQGTAAELTKAAMLAVSCFIQDQGLESRMIMQVHDELVFEVPAGEVEKLQDALPKLMQEALPQPLRVPLSVEIGVGKSWLEAH
jgi:DNA polymerase-1